MMITRKYLPRRTFLRGLGTVIALPFLDAMTPAFAGPAASKSPLRAGFTYIPNGVTPKEWKPTGEGKDYQFSRILKPLEGMRDHINILSNLDHHQANSLGDGGGDHGRAGACFLTGVHPKKTAGADIRVGISADQIAAREVGSQTRFASLELGCEDTRTVGNCDSGYSCAYTNSISWKGPSTPLPPETNPRLVFERLFGTEDLSLSPETRAWRTEYRRSILDMVGERSKSLASTLGSADRRKLDEYTSGIREIERRIERAEKETKEFQPDIEKPAGIPILFSEHVKLMYDLQVLAFQADLTRVVTLMLGREGSVRVYNEIGIPDPHHPLTHHRNNPEMIEKITKISTFHTNLLAYFLEKLKNTPDGDGTLLHHSMIVFASAIADGNPHSHEDLPVILAGHGGGSIVTGQHVVYPKATPMTNLYMTVLDRMGVKPENIGDSTGKLQHLTDL